MRHNEIACCRRRRSTLQAIGAAGKKLLTSNVRRIPSQASSGGYDQPPHPKRVLPGQKFWPLTGKIRRAFVVTRLEPRAGRAHCQRVDGARERLTIKLERLLADTPTAEGRFYRLLGYASDERRYPTWAHVIAVVGDGDRATLVAPEWHPERPIEVPARHLPSDATPGSWVACTAVLAAQHPAGVQLAFTGLQDPPPDTIRPVADSVVAAAARRRPQATPELVLDINRSVLPPVQSNDLTWFSVSDRIPDRAVLEPHATIVWLAEPSGELGGCGRLRAVRMTANATLLGLDGDSTPADTGAMPTRPDDLPHRPGRLRFPWWEPAAPLPPGP